MKRMTAILLIMALLLGCCAALGESAESRYDLLRVGTTTEFSGNFFSGAIGNNVSDQDVRKLIHGYNLVEWVPEEGVFRPNQQVVTAFSSTTDNTTFVFAISKDLKYNDGTPITAKDYAFSFLLQTSAALQEAAGSRVSGDYVWGWKPYDEGTAATVSGFRLMGDYQISITLSNEYMPYYYEMQALSIEPYPASVLAPGIEVRDDGNGIYLSAPLTAEMLQTTLLDPETGYAAHPTVSCGPYRLTDFDGTTARFVQNPEYNGDVSGNKSSIPEIEFSYVKADRLINKLAAGELDLVVRCARNDQIQSGIALTSTGDFSYYAYSRNGLAYISFCAEKGATADVHVRQALAMCMDKAALQERYLGNYGLAIDGYYGIGQWMYLASNGTIVVENEGEKPDENAEEDRPNMDGLTVWPLDTDRANELLDEAGWTLNDQGGDFVPGTDTVRCRVNKGRLEKLQLKLVYADNNGAGALLPELFVQNVAKVGGEVELVELPMPDVLNLYYHITDRDCDMIMLGSNLGDVFEPTTDFDGDVHRISGIEDPQFAALALDMRRTEPGRALDYVRKWIRFLEYRSEILPEIPLYSNAYMDFCIVELQNYAPGSYSSWAEAVQYAVLSDVAPEEEPELEDDEFMFDD